MRLSKLGKVTDTQQADHDCMIDDSGPSGPTTKRRYYPYVLTTVDTGVEIQVGLIMYSVELHPSRLYTPISTFGAHENVLWLQSQLQVDFKRKWVLYLVLVALP